jgi:hypothetical protein
MGRPNLGGYAKRNIVTVRLSDAEAAAFDVERGQNTRSAYLRAIVVTLTNERRRQREQTADDTATAD